MDDEYGKVMKEFYRIYRALQEKYNLLMRSRFKVNKDGLIEIWECEGEKKKNCICRITEEDDIMCYKKAIAMLEMYSRGKDEKYERKAG